MVSLCLTTFRFVTGMKDGDKQTLIGGSVSIRCFSVKCNAASFLPYIDQRDFSWVDERPFPHTGKGHCMIQRISGNSLSFIELYSL